MKKAVKIFLITLSLLSIVFMPMPASAKAVKAKTMLEVREIQTHYFETPDTEKVMKAVINTLQDNGFVIQNIEDSMGFITARKDFRGRRTDKGRVAVYSVEFAYYGACTAITFGALAPYMIIPIRHLNNELSLHPVSVNSNVTIEKIGKRTKVRFTFVEKIMENSDGYLFFKSAPRKVVRYYNADIYQEFFNQVDKNLFIENI